MINNAFIYKISKLVFIFILSLLLNSCDNSLKNNDILPLLIETPNQLEFVDFKTGSCQIVFEVKYKVSGKNAHIVEDLLHKKYGMNKLKFVCCGWETSKNGTLEITDNFYNKYGKRYDFNHISIKMHSTETLIQDQKQWHKIPYFYIIVEVLKI